MFHEGRQIGSYTLLRKLGKGGFGEVWLAEKRSQFVTKKVAVKLPLDEQVNFDAIRQEAELWEQASGHPNVLPIIDADVFDGQVLIVSEYADGGSLADRLKREGKLTLQKAVEITIGILNGLEFLHSRKIIHRDIKPQNILLQGDTPRLADFGISRAMNTTIVSSAIIGTDAYMSPESFDGKRNVQTDIWSVGVVLYALMADSLPFPQEHPSERMFAILTKEFEPLPAEIPQNLQRIVARSLAKQPENRYQTTSEMRDELQKALLGIAHPTFAPTEVFRLPIENLPTIPTLENKYETNEPEKETVVSPQKFNVPAPPDASPEFQTENAPTIATNQPDIRTNQTEQQPTLNFVKPTEPAIEVNSPAGSPSVVTQIKPPPQTGDSAKPFPTVVQPLAESTYDSKRKRGSKPLYYALAALLFLLPLAIFVGINGLNRYKGTEQSANSNKAANPPSNTSTKNTSTNSLASTGGRLIPYLKGNKWGYVDENKKFVIEPKYDDVCRFHEDLACVKAVDKWGFIDKTGKEVIALKYKEVGSFSEELALVTTNDKSIFINKTGEEIISPNYKTIWSFSEGLAGVCQYDNEKCGFIDKTGKEVIPLKFNIIHSFSEGLAGVCYYGGEKCGYIDKTGKNVITAKYGFLLGSFSEGLAAVSIGDPNQIANWKKGNVIVNDYGYIDQTGKEIIPFKYHGAGNFNDGIADVTVEDKDGNRKQGFIDKTGNFLIPPKYYIAYPFSEGLARVMLTQGTKWGYIDKTDKQIIPFKYDDADQFKDGLSRVKLGGKEFYIGKDGTEYYEP